MTMLKGDWWEGRTRAYNLLLLLEMRNCKFLPRTGGPTLGWAPKTQRKGFSGNSRAGLRGAGCLAFVPEAGSRHRALRGGVGEVIGLPVDLRVPSSSAQSLRSCAQSRRPSTPETGPDRPALKLQTGLALLSSSSK